MADSARPLPRSVEPLQILLRCSGGVAPWEEFVEAYDLVVDDFGEDPGKSRLEIDAFEFGGLNQGEGDGHCFAATF
ncbi:hypothetical protein [uncultured Ruegeria sp.]|uniref:hypothetical protein n=1 Tax=uncultured Ruegeria sp. TaxID=259304 RepID=UPI00261C5BB4|nr:hypothetical protein [uncultured Ruegeria sp.]